MVEDDDKVAHHLGAGHQRVVQCVEEQQEARLPHVELLRLLQLVVMEHPARMLASVPPGHRFHAARSRPPLPAAWVPRRPVLSTSCRVTEREVSMHVVLNVWGDLFHVVSALSSPEDTKGHS